MLVGFIGYRKTNSALCARLFDRLRPLKDDGLVEFWFDQRMEPGDRWGGVVEAVLSRAELSAFLVTTQLVGDNYAVDDELPVAKAREAKGETTIIPITHDDVLSAIKNDLCAYNAVPRGGASVALIGDQERWFELVKEDIRRAAKSRLRGQEPTSVLIPQKLLALNAIAKRIRGKILSNPQWVRADKRLARTLVSAAQTPSSPPRLNLSFR